jgi:hypothetical protein
MVVVVVAAAVVVGDGGEGGCAWLSCDECVCARGVRGMRVRGVRLSACVIVVRGLSVFVIVTSSCHYIEACESWALGIKM